MIRFKVYRSDGRIEIVESPSKEQLLSSLQEAVHGYIEIVDKEYVLLSEFTKVKDDELIICNEEGRIKYMKRNIYFPNLVGDIVTIKSGDME